MVSLPAPKHRVTKQHPVFLVFHIDAITFSFFFFLMCEIYYKKKYILFPISALFYRYLNHLSLEDKGKPGISFPSQSAV